jgi:predicted Rossmann-fold nucleotide-binding protein
MNNNEKIDIEIRPEGSLDILSRSEIARLSDKGAGGLYKLFRVCTLAILNTGAETDDTRQILKDYRDFSVEFIQQHRGIKLALKNAPMNAFVDGKMIQGIQEQLFSVLRDLVYSTEQVSTGVFNLDTSEGITEAVFHIMRNANVLRTSVLPKMVVCWGGHSINREEYRYCKEVGYRLGLRGLDVCTGCGAGAMKGPMKGANLGHAKQRINNGRYVGISEPSIIAAESPNAVVNELVIMPDIEKRLEAFVRFGHGIIVFPGGVGTAEEILYIMGILLSPENDDIKYPVIFAAPESSKEYFNQLDEFLVATLGEKIRSYYKIMIGDPIQVAREMKTAIDEVRHLRKEYNDAYYFNWRLHIDKAFQLPFETNHDNVRELEISRDLSSHDLAVNLRRVFSCVVAGNVREDGILAVEENGPYEFRGDEQIMSRLDALLDSFVSQKRMNLTGKEYKPCYRLIS